MADIGQEQYILDAVEQVYGTRGGPRDYWYKLKREHPDYTEEQLLQALQTEPTCNYSFFLRESNIRGLAWLVAQEKQKDWNILDIGRGYGPEPYELAMRILNNGSDNFSIDGFDISDKAIQKAKEGKFYRNQSYIFSSEGEFMDEMERAGLLRIERETKTKISSRDQVDYRADDKVTSKLSFAVHDIIDGPIQTSKAYDLAICNTVLQHYPEWTRELILINMLKNLKDGGILALEHNEVLDGFGSTPERIAWLRPYYQWKETLDKFGLHKEKIEPEGFWLPMTVYRYNQSQNSFKGRNYGVRNQSLVEMK